MKRHLRCHEAKRKVTFSCGEATLHRAKPCFIFHARQRASFPKRKALLLQCFSFWRHHPESNWGIKVLQTSALPLGYGTVKNGAVDEARTRDLNLGKVALYQMSYTRIPAPVFKDLCNGKWCLRSESNQRHVDFQSTALPTELQRHIEQSIQLCSDALYGDPERTRTVDLQRDRLAC